MSETITVQGTVIAETSLAWKVTTALLTLWLPKSQVERTVWDGLSMDDFEVPLWLAEQEGIE